MSKEPLCWGRPHNACLKVDIPIIIVRDNTTRDTTYIPDDSRIIYVENYWEAVGVIMSEKAGICPLSVRRPLKRTKVIR
jgi:hypothetical protein